LRPRPEDYPKVFDPSVLDRARRHYDRLWDSPPALGPHGMRTEVIAHVCPAGMLDRENELSRNFPGGYRAIAHVLLPHRVWACWKYVEPGETSGVAYDGLVWCDDHWSWFPKPYRPLAGAE
jgi:hypothetical protein